MSTNNAAFHAQLEAAMVIRAWITLYPKEPIPQFVQDEYDERAAAWKKEQEAQQCGSTSLQ